MRVRLTAMCVALLCSGCGEDERLQGGTPVPFAPAAAGATSFGAIPWPSDLYLDGSGRVGEVPGLSRIAASSASIQAGLSEMDGFGRATGALFFLEAEIAATSLPRLWEDATSASASVFIADVDPTSARQGTRYPAFAKPLPSLGCIAVIPVPGVVLPPGVQHAAVLTTRVRTMAGASLGPDEPLREIANTPASQRNTAAAKLYGDAIDRLVAAELVANSEEVASLAVFTTTRQVFELPKLRAVLRAQPVPKLLLNPTEAVPYTVAAFQSGGSPSLDDWLGAPEPDENGVAWPGGDNPGGIAHDAIAAVVSAAFVAPSFLDPKSGHFATSPTGEFSLANPDATIPVTIVIPKQPPPTDGYPVVINGHGLSNNRGSMLSVANELARGGFVVIGVDDVLHGARQGVKDTENNYPGTFLGPDGIPDSAPFPVAFFSDFADFVAVRDNFRQTVLDHCSLVRLIQSGPLDLSSLLGAAAGATLPLDPSRVFWSGGSLGGIMGAMTAAVEPDIRGFALQVPGASFVQLITTSSAKIAPLVNLLATTAFGIQGDEVRDEFHPVATLLAAITEAGDPIAYAPHVMRDALHGGEPPDVLLTYAAGDEVLPNIATFALVRALGIPRAGAAIVPLPGVASAPSPVSANFGGRTGAVVEYAPANHGLGYERFDTREFLPGIPFEDGERFVALPKSFQIETPIREHAAQLVEFLQTSGGGKATIRVTAPARADFDADGVLDADEEAAGTDPTDPSQ
ncbi:MAG TPA: hypothetical protein PKD61_00110 [Polyangiaceae bacterium]|nr:hypothetical protein [Polyangiaceae bacterium]